MNWVLRVSFLDADGGLLMIAEAQLKRKMNKVFLLPCKETEDAVPGRYLRLVTTNPVPAVNLQSENGTIQAGLGDKHGTTLILWTEEGKTDSSC